MPLPGFHSRLGNAARVFRQPRRRKVLQSSAARLISSENRLEDRILLSATTVDDTPVDEGTVADITTADDLAADNALMDAVAEAAVFDTEESNHVAPVQNLIDDGIDSYLENTSDRNAVFDTTEVLEGSPVEDDLETYAGALDEVRDVLTDTIADNTADVGGETGVADDAPEHRDGDDEIATEGTENTKDGADEEPADPRFQWTAFAFRDQLENVTVPVERLGSLFDVKPDGQQSFSTTTVTAAEPVTEVIPEKLGTGTKTTSATTEVTLQQQVTSPSEWVVTQSWNRRLSSNEQSTDDDGNNQDFDRDGTEGLTISVINGTTTVMTYSVSDTFRYSTGEIEGFDDTTPAESRTVPQNWIDTASYAKTDEETKHTEDDDKDLPAGQSEGGDEGGDEEIADDEEDGNSQGTRYVSTASLTITVTTRLLTLEDGRTGQSTIISWNASRSFTSLIAGSYSVSDNAGTLTSWSLDDAQDDTTDDQKPGDGGEDGKASAGNLIQLSPETADNGDEASDGSDAGIASGGNGHSLHASGEFFAFGHASLTFGGGITVTVMDDGSTPPATPAGSATFGLSLGSGTFRSQSLNVQLQESSGDSYEYLSSSDSSTNGGAAHFRYTVTAPLSDRVETNTGTSAESQPGAITADANTDDDTGVTSVLSFGSNSHHSNSRNVSYVQHLDQDEPTFRSEATSTYQESSTQRGASGIGYENETFTTSASSFNEQDISRTASGNSWHQTSDNSEVTADYSRSVGAYLLDSNYYSVTAGADDVAVTSDGDFEVDIHDLGHHRLEGRWTETDDAGQPVATHTGVYETRAAFTWGGQADPDSEFDPTATWSATNTRNGNPTPADLPLSDEPLLDLLLADITATRDMVLADNGTTDGTAATITAARDSGTATVETDTVTSTADENGTDTQDAVGQTVPDNGATTAAFRGDDDWEEPGTSSEKTTDEILDEYWDRKAKTDRLKQRLAETSDPAMREFYENQINIENEILDVLQEEAAERGIDLDSPLPPQPQPPTDADEEGDADESDGFNFLDGIQLALDGAGMMPGVGIVADALNAAISLGRGDLIGAGLNALAMIPIIGQGVKALDKAADAAKAADKAVDAARAADKAADAAIRAADPKAVVNALSGFRSRKFFVNGQNILLDKKGLKHILERHHPSYWNGTTKSLQSFFPKNTSIHEIESIVRQVLKQNPERIAEIGSNRLGTMTGVVNGIRYQLGLNRGRVGQLFPILD